MLKNYKRLLGMAVALLMLSGQAFAGDGGAKRNATLRVQNDFGAVIGVIVDADEDDLEEAALSDNPEQAFQDLGGVILNDGETATFDVRAGRHDVFVVDGADPTFTNTLSGRVTVARGATRTLTVVRTAQGNLDFGP